MKTDFTTVLDTVTEVLGAVAAEKTLEVGELKGSQRLIDDLGFKSLDLARIIALLEGRFAVDPFAELVPITSVKTIDDLAQAYRLAIEQGDTLDA